MAVVAVRRPRPVVRLVAAGVVLAAVLVWAACDQGVVVIGRRHVAMPPDTASPAEVVAAYLAALDAHDCATARRLSRDGSADLWCRDVLHLTHVRISSPFAEDPSWSGRQGGQVVDVPAAFDLDWRLFHDDGTVPEGPMTWSYLVERDSDAGPWRIGDEGEG